MKITIQDGDVSVTVERPGEAQSIHSLLYGLVIPALHSHGYHPDLVSRFIEVDEDRAFNEMYANG